jgi:hypothetical protein
MNFNILSLTIELLLASFCFISCIYYIHKKGLKHKISAQTVYLMISLFFVFTRILLLLISESIFVWHYQQGIEDQSFVLSHNWRIITVLLSFYEISYMIVYFNKFRFNRPIKVADKVFTVITQGLIYTIPILFLFALTLGGNNLGVDLKPFYYNHSYLVLSHTLPESPLSQKLIEIIFILYVLLALIPIKTIWQKHWLIKTTYILFLTTIFFKIGCSNFIFVSKDILQMINSFYRFGLNISFNLFFIFMYFTGRFILVKSDNTIISE